MEDSELQNLIEEYSNLKEMFSLKDDAYYRYQDILIKQQINQTLVDNNKLLISILERLEKGILTR